MGLLAEAKLHVSDLAKAIMKVFGF
jgi:hypothetical protein